MRGTLLILLAALALVLAAPAAASEIIDRDVELLSFKVNAAGPGGARLPDALEGPAVRPRVRGALDAPR